MYCGLLANFFGLMNNSLPVTSSPFGGNSTTTVLETTHANSLKKLYELSQQISATHKECFEVERGIALLREQLGGNPDAR